MTNRRKPKASVTAAMSFRGIAACRAVRSVCDIEIDSPFEIRAGVPYLEQGTNAC